MNVLSMLLTGAPYVLCALVGFFFGYRMRNNQTLAKLREEKILSNKLAGGVKLDQPITKWNTELEPEKPQGEL